MNTPTKPRFFPSVYQNTDTDAPRLLSYVLRFNEARQDATREDVLRTLEYEKGIREGGTLPKHPEWRVVHIEVDKVVNDWNVRVYSAHLPQTVDLSDETIGKLAEAFARKLIEAMTK